jgi:hypothetical protein
MAAKVCLDTNVFKFAATALPRTRRVFTGVNWGGHRQIAEVHQPIVVNPSEKIAAGSELKAEVELLPKVAHLAHEGVIVLAISVETQVELSGIPDLDSMAGDLYNAPRITLEPPIRYGRVLFGGTEDFREAQFSFIESLGDSRFLELRRACGAQQGKKVNRNQLLADNHPGAAGDARANLSVVAAERTCAVRESTAESDRGTDGCGPDAAVRRERSILN